MTPQLTPWTLGGKTCCRWKFITLALKGGGYIKQQTTKSSFCSRLKNSMNKIAIYQEIGIYKMCAKRIILVRPWRKPWGLKVQNENIHTLSECWRIASVREVLAHLLWPAAPNSTALAWWRPEEDTMPTFSRPGGDQSRWSAWLSTDLWGF